MELTSIVVEDTAAVKMAYPGSGRPIMSTTTGEQCSITIYGPGSKVAVELSRKAQQKATNMFLKHRGKGVMVDVREREAEDTDALVDLTVSLNGFTYKGANDKDAIRAMYADPDYGWVRTLVNDTAGEWADFLKVPKD